MPNPTDTGPAKPGGSAAEFLNEEAERAKQAIVESLRHAAESLGEAVDPRQLTKAHPLLTVTSAIVAGFAAAVVAIPSKEEQELRRVERLRRVMEPKPEPKPKSDGNGVSAEPKGPLWMSLVHEVIQLARPLLTAAITAQLSKNKPVADAKVDPDPVPPVG